MEKHIFTKYEIATYLRDYNRLMSYALENPDIPFYQIFKHHMSNDGRIQYSIKDYYYEMISIYEMLLMSKFLTMLYDNRFDYLLDSHINALNIPDNIFINKSDRNRFSKKQIIINIRNAFNHNDNPNYDLLKFIRVNENGREKIKVEILLKNAKPIPFHVIFDVEQLISICFEIMNSNNIVVVSNRSTKPIDLDSSNVDETLDNIYLRKFYSRKKLSDEQKEQILKHIMTGKGTKGYEELFLANGMEYKDFKYSLEQKLKIEEDLKRWEFMGIDGNDIFSHLLNKVVPVSYLRDRVFAMNFILSNFFVRNGDQCFWDLVQEAKKVLNNKSVALDSLLYMYVNSFGIDNNIVYDAMDFENITSITNAIYYGFLFDTLIVDEDINMGKIMFKREKIRDSFVHMRWFKGINDCYKLFDWGNGIDDEFNRDSESFWRANIPYADMERCAEGYFKACIESRNSDEIYMDLPIHFKRKFFEDGTNEVISISFIKKGVFYYVDLSSDKSDYCLMVCDDKQILRPANEDEKGVFIDELNCLSEEERSVFGGKITEIKDSLLQSNIGSNLKR